jgi:hypothetical protein
MIEMMKDDKEEQQRKIETAKGDLEKSAEEMQMKEVNDILYNNLALN